MKAVTNRTTEGQFPTMSEEEAAPFKPDLTRLPSDGEYHFEYVELSHYATLC